MKQLVPLDDNGATVRQAGVMSVVQAAGIVRSSSGIRFLPAAGRHEPLQPA